MTSQDNSNPKPNLPKSLTPPKASVSAKAEAVPEAKVPQVETKGVASRIKELTIEENPKINVLVYGFPGAGKTRLSGTMAAFSNPLILSAESGLLSLRKLQKEMGVKFKYLDIKDFNEMIEAYNFLLLGKHDYDAVVIDSITEIQQACMDKILEEEKRDKALIQDWGTLATRMISLIRKFRDLPMHCMVTCLAEQDKDETTGMVCIRPLVQGQLKEKIDAYFDEVLYLASKEVKGEDGKPKVVRWLETQNTTRIRAKDRSGELPHQARPDMKYVYETIVKGVTK